MNKRCRHYSVKGMHGECAKGVDIKKLASGFGAALRLPCALNDRSENVVECTLCEYQTPEEVAEEGRRFEAAVDAFAKGKSPCCGAALIAKGNYRFCATCEEAVAHVLCERRTPVRCGCGNRETAKCSYELRGAKAGKTCGASLCSSCAVNGMCGPHSRRAAQEATVQGG